MAVSGSPHQHRISYSNDVVTDSIPNLPLGGELSDSIAYLLDEGGGFSGDSSIRDYSIALHLHVGLRRFFDARIERVNRNDMAFDVPVEIGRFNRSVINRLEFLAANPMPIPETKDYMFW